MSDRPDPKTPAEIRDSRAAAQSALLALIMGEPEDDRDDHRERLDSFGIDLEEAETELRARLAAKGAQR